MADIDEKTQKLIDKAVKTAKKEQLKAITDVIKSAQDTNKDNEDKAAKKAIQPVLAEVMRDVKAAAAD